MDIFFTVLLCALALIYGFYGIAIIVLNILDKMEEDEDES